MRESEGKAKILDQRWRDTQGEHTSQSDKVWQIGELDDRVMVMFDKEIGFLWFLWALNWKMD